MITTTTGAQASSLHVFGIVAEYLGCAKSIVWCKNALRQRCRNERAGTRRSHSGFAMRS